MKYCRYCGKAVNDNSSFCKYCGKNLDVTNSSNGQLPMSPTIAPPAYPAYNRKKQNENLAIVAIVLFVIGTIMLGLCFFPIMNNVDTSSSNSAGSTNDDSSTTDTSNGDTTTSTTNPYYHKCGYNYNIEYTAGIYDGYSGDISYDYPSVSNYRYAIVTLKVVNNGDEEITTNPYYWEFNLNGILYQYSSETYSSLIEKQTVTLVKGGSATTEIVYEVPNGTSGGSIAFKGLISIYDTYKDYVYRDTSIVVSVPSTVNAPVLYSAYDGRTVNSNSFQIPVSWNNVANAGYYELQTSQTADFSQVNEDKYSTGTSASISVWTTFPFGQVHGTEFIRVRAYDGWGRSVGEWSNAVMVTIDTTS